MTDTRDPLPGIPIPLRWSDDGRAVLLLDQTLLPTDERYLRLERVEEVAESISSLRVRGAPAIGIAAAMGLAMGCRLRVEGGPQGPSNAELEEGFRRDSRILLSSRPTAVNLPWAVARMEKAFLDQATQGLAHSICDALVLEADLIAAEDREMCRLIGEHGAALIPDAGAGVLTHCNAGALATGGIGTALAPVYTAQSRGVAVKLFANETRPLLQGARLTAWEATRAGVDVSVITDSMAAALLRKGRVNLVFVGADRVAANGDVANKVGTYGLAVLANYHGIPFYVALPSSTFDLGTETGEDIPIEERARSEITGPVGQVTVPEPVDVWNPAFDVTPAHLVTAFVTPRGVLRPPFGRAIADLLGADPSPARGEPTKMEGIQ